MRRFGPIYVLLYLSRLCCRDTLLAQFKQSTTFWYNQHLCENSTLNTSPLFVEKYFSLLHVRTLVKCGVSSDKLALNHEQATSYVLRPRSAD